MAVYDTGYFHTLDREYELFNNFSGGKKSDKQLAEPLLRVDQIGTSVAEGREGGGRFRQTVLAAMSKGVREIELSMSPSNVQSGPSSYSEQEKEELREMARLNRVRFTSTHVSPTSVGNLSGLGQRGFSEEERQRQLNEIKQAIHFAAETALGGAVVVHTGEFPRDFSKYESQGFMEFAGDGGKKERIHLFVDKRTGEIIHTVKEDAVNYEFEYLGKDGKSVKDPKQAQVDNFDHPILFRDDKGNYKAYERNWDDYKSAAKELEKEGKKVLAEELFFKDTMRTAKEKAESQAKDFGARYEEEKIHQSKILRDYDNLLKIRDLSPDKMKAEAEDRIQEVVGESNITNEQAVKRLESLKENVQKKMDSLYEAMVSTNRKVKELERVQEMTVPISRYATVKSAESLALLGIEAMKETEWAKKKFEGKERVQEIFIAPENIFPEMGYGSHPEELAQMVIDSRKKMVEILHSQGVSEKEAEKQAESHIKATLDTEHVGMWKRFFQRGSNESIESYDKRFNSWYVGQIEKLAEKKVLGHIHLADGFGMGHANLPPGSGILPIKDAVQKLKEKGFGGTFESEGYGDPLKQETGAWTYFGSPIYAMGGKNQQYFNKIHEKYSMVPTPYREVTPPYYPSEDWKVWSEIPLD